MKNFKFLGAIAFALLLSLNVGTFVESNDWETVNEVAHAQIQQAPLAQGWGLREITINCPDGTLAIGCLTRGLYCRRVRCN